MPRTKKRIVKIYDLGPEPVDVIGLAKLARAYQWYNYEYSRREGRKFADGYIKTRSKEEQQLFARLDDVEIPSTYMWIAHMMDRGLTLMPTTRQWFAARHAQLLELARTKREETVPVIAPKITRTPQRNSDRIIAFLDSELDIRFDLKDFVFDAYEYLQAEKTSTADIQRLIAYYEPIAEELKLAVLGKDEQLNEAYSFLKKMDLRKRSDFMSQIVSDIKRMINNKAVVRKPRKKRVKSATALVKSVKYQKEANDLKLVSTNPEKIIGSTQVWVYNTKYNQLGVIDAMDGGLTIKGSTIINFNEATSKFKRLRKPKEQLSQFLSGGKVQTRKFLQTINSKEYPMSGRLNANTIILKVI